MKSIQEIILPTITLPTKAKSCEKHGYYMSTNFIADLWTSCKLCVEEKEKEKVKIYWEDRALEITEDKFQKSLVSSCISLRFQDRLLESYQAKSAGQKKALEFSKEYAQNFDEVIKTGRSVIFVGKPGTGKTHLAVGIALHIMKENRSALFITVQRAIRSIKDTWGKDSNISETQAIESLSSPDLLILDEVGVQFGSDFEKQIIFDILNDRYEKMKPTVLISNVSPGELNTYLGERVMDRLKEGGGKLISFDWESYRGRC